MRMLFLISKFTYFLLALQIFSYAMRFYFFSFDAIKFLIFTNKKKGNDKSTR